MNKTIFGIFFISLCAALANCSTPVPSKIVPEYTGVDPRAQPIVNEYFSLSKMHKIQFNNSVSIGFKKINHGNVIGICNYGANFREIDLDIDYWNNSSKMSHLSLLFHELSHCYCDRDHDYGDGKGYPESEEARIERALRWQIEGGPRPGYWDDGCPVSLMYPVVVDDECAHTHYGEYIEEMFDRCEPW